MPGTKTHPVYEHCGRRIKDLESKRLLTFVDGGNVCSYETGLPVKRRISLSLTDVSELRGTGAAVIEGIPVNRAGVPRKNGNVRRLIVTEGSFLVWW